MELTFVFTDQREADTLTSADQRRRAWARVHCPLCGKFAQYLRYYVTYAGETRIVARCAAHGEQEIY